MHYSWKLAGITFLAAGLTVLAGCGSSESTPVTASIGGPTTSTKTSTPAATAPGKVKRRQPSDAELLHPKVLIETSLGSVTVELDAEKVPRTVENFLMYVDRGHYDQTIFHQVVKNYVILGGSYDAKYVEKPSRAPVLNEAHKGLKNIRGTIAMARRPDGIDTATSQFFINLIDNSSLDHKDKTLNGYGYCAFGRVIAGLDIVEKISQVEVRNVDQFEQTPVKPLVIRSIRRVQ